jgi:hypothetical protein
MSTLVNASYPSMGCGASKDVSGDAEPDGSDTLTPTTVSLDGPLSPRGNPLGAPLPDSAAVAPVAAPVVGDASSGSLLSSSLLSGWVLSPHDVAIEPAVPWSSESGLFLTTTATYRSASPVEAEASGFDDPQGSASFRSIPAASTTSSDGDATPNSNAAHPLNSPKEDDRSTGH